MENPNPKITSKTTKQKDKKSTQINKKKKHKTLIHKRKQSPIQFNIEIPLAETGESRGEFENEKINQQLKQNPVNLIDQTNNIFGNYQNYYKYKSQSNANNYDPRIECLSKDYFYNQKCLDIGCNDGSVTILIARNYVPEEILGIDIDYRLINTAIKNLKSHQNYQAFLQNQNTSDNHSDQILEPNNIKQIQNLPKSFQIYINNITANIKHFFEEKYQPSIEDNVTQNIIKYLDNVHFRIENYIQSLDTHEQYDTILCLSTSKWIHLNWGDIGIRRLFLKVYNQLKPNGYFIFEPSEWKSYQKKKCLSNHIKETYQKIQFNPKFFEKYLTERLNFKLVERINPKLKVEKQDQQKFVGDIYIYQKLPTSH